jgi:hypothetical protein
MLVQNNQGFAWGGKICQRPFHQRKLLSVGHTCLMQETILNTRIIFVVGSGTVYTPTKMDDIGRANRIKGTIQKATVFNIAQAKRNHRPYYSSTKRFILSTWNQRVLVATQFSTSNIGKHAASVMVGGGGQL